VSRLGFSGRVYQRRKVRKYSALWKVKQGQAKLEAGSTLSGEKVGLILMVGNEASFPASENVLCGGGGESEALQLAIRQPEELVVASPGSESDCSRQSGFSSHEARKSIELEEKGSVVEEGSTLVLLETVGGLLLAPQVSSLQVYAVLGNSVFGTELVD
jgi:hypothetical protein